MELSQDSISESRKSGYSTPKFQKSGTMNTAFTSTAITFKCSQTNFHESSSQSKTGSNKACGEKAHEEKVMHLGEGEEFEREYLPPHKMSILIPNLDTESKAGSLVTPSHQLVPKTSRDLTKKVIFPGTEKCKKPLLKVNVQAMKSKIKLFKVKSSENLAMKNFPNFERSKPKKESRNAKCVIKGLKTNFEQLHKHSSNMKDFICATERNAKTNPKFKKVLLKNSSNAKNKIKLAEPSQRARVKLSSNRGNLESQAKASLNLLIRFERTPKQAQKDSNPAIIAKLYPKQVEIAPTFAKSKRTKSHDPASNRKYRGSIQEENGLADIS